MSGPPFARARDLVTLVPGTDEARAELAVRVVSDAIRSTLGWPVDQHTTTHTERTRARSLVLPARNITTVTAVLVDGTTLTADQWWLQSSGIIRLKVRPWETVAVTYTAGFVRAPEDKAPGILRQVCLDHAVRMVANPEGLRSFTLGGASETYPDGAPTVTDDPRLDAWKV